MTLQPDTPLRADARRNRDQLLAAAKTLFVQSGLDVPMEAIAREARVGVGTLYRRFPDRQALIRAVATDNLRAVLADVQAAASEEPTSWDALIRLLTGSEQLRLTVRMALLSLRSWNAVRGDPQTRDARIELLVALDGLVRGAQREGSLRRDVGIGDLLAIISLVLRPDIAGHDAAPGVLAERALRVMLDGLRAQSSSPLPGSPVTTRDLDLRISRYGRNNSG